MATNVNLKLNYPIEKITFAQDVDCEDCCGVRASLNGDYKYKIKFELFWRY